MTDQRYVVNVDAAIVRDGLYLLCERGADEDHAPGALGLVGGTVEPTDEGSNVLEATVRREVEEELGVALDGTMAYVRSGAFVADTGDRVVDVVYLCRIADGEPTIEAPEEIAALEWLSAEGVADHPNAPDYLREQIALAEGQRLALGW